jgi:hypothetical protein
VLRAAPPGDYQGRINIWGLFTGERKSWLSHRAERYETGVEKLLWLPAFSPAQRCASAMAAAALTASAASLVSASADASSFFVGLGQQQQQRQQQGLQQQHLMGGIPVIIPSTMSVASELSLADDIGSHAQQRPERRQQQQQQQCPGIAADSAAAGDAGGAGSSSCTPRPAAAAGDGELDVADEEPDALLLLSAGGDGILRVWLINHLAQGQMLCTLPGGWKGGCSEQAADLLLLMSCLSYTLLFMPSSPVSATRCSSHLCMASPCYVVVTSC